MVLVLWGSTGEEERRFLSLKRAHPQRPEVTSPYLGQPEGGERGIKPPAPNHQQLVQEMSTSYSGMQRVYTTTTTTAIIIIIIIMMLMMMINKMIALVARLDDENIEVACLHEAHRKKSQRFNIRGYKVFRGQGKQDLRRSVNPCKKLCPSPRFYGQHQQSGNKSWCYYHFGEPTDQRALPSPHRTTRQIVPCVCGHPEIDRRGEEVEDW